MGKEGTSVKQQHLKGLESDILSESAKNLQFMLLKLLGYMNKNIIMGVPNGQGGLISYLGPSL